MRCLAEGEPVAEQARGLSAMTRGPGGMKKIILDCQSACVAL